MTQGYGPDHRQQGQRGQGSPEVAPVSSADAPGPVGADATSPHTGVSPVSPTAPVGLIRWMFFVGIAVVAVRALLVLSTIFLSVYYFGLASTATDPNDLMISFGIGSVVISGGQLVTVVLSVALLTLAIIVAVKAKERGRTGAIIVGGAVVLSFVVYVAVYFVARFIFITGPGFPGGDVDSIFTISIIDHVVRAVHWLLFSAAVLIGAARSRRWARQNT